MTPDTTDDRCRQLMMAALDGEITDDERGEFDRYLREHPDAAEEWQQMNRVKEVTSTMTPREPGQDVWQDYWTSVYRRLERGVGWVFFSVGAIVLLGYGIWEALDALFRDTSVPEVVRIALLLTLLGLGILLISVVREKLFANRHESFKDVHR